MKYALRRCLWSVTYPGGSETQVTTGVVGRGTLLSCDLYICFQGIRGHEVFQACCCSLPVWAGLLPYRGSSAKRRGGTLAHPAHPGVTDRPRQTGESIVSAQAGLALPYRRSATWGVARAGRYKLAARHESVAGGGFMVASPDRSSQRPERIRSDRHA